MGLGMRRMRISHELLCVTTHQRGVGRGEKLKEMKLLTVCRKAGMASCGTFSLNDLACKTDSAVMMTRYQSLATVLYSISHKPFNYWVSLIVNQIGSNKPVKIIFQPNIKQKHILLKENYRIFLRCEFIFMTIKHSSPIIFNGNLYYTGLIFF